MLAFNKYWLNKGLALHPICLTHFSYNLGYCLNFVPGYGSMWSEKMGKKPILMEDSRRSTYYESQPSSSMYDLPVSSSYNGTKKLLVPVECPN